MALTERQQHDAYEALQGAFGDRTDIVIGMFRLGDDLVTKDDLAVTTAVLRTEMADLRTEMAELRVDFTAGIHEATTSQTRVLLFGMIGAVIVSGAMNSMAYLLG